MTPTLIGTLDSTRTLADVVPPEQSIIVTIDGPAGTGKSSVAWRLAQKLGVDVLDTGAMYRAATAIAIDRNIPDEDVDQILRVVMDADLHFDWNASPPAILAWNRPMGERIRDADVSARVSTIAAIGPLREHMVRKQRIIAHQHPRLVSDGRDQGSVAFPDAEVKFYLDADVRVRALRRASQIERESGRRPELNQVVRNLERRDHLDKTRKDGPLVVPDGAIIVDTSELDLDQVVNHLYRQVCERILQD
ncbi:MAG: (d)CMP kinase [Phycisphaerales bacterium]